MYNNQTVQKRLALCGILTALALALSFAERMIPLGLLVPVPGIKLGLANIVTLFALLFLGRREAFSILLCRVVLGSIFAGSVTAFAFSLFGGVCAFAVMSLLTPYLGKAVSLWGVSAAGAAMHNFGQIAAAVILLGTTDVFAYLPFLLITAIPMGLITGTLAEALSKSIQRIKV